MVMVFGETSSSSSSDVGEASTSAAGSHSPLVHEFVEMGFSVDMVTKAIEENGEHNTEKILETLLAYSATLSNRPSEFEPVSYDLQSSESENDFLDDLSDFEGCLDNEVVHLIFSLNTYITLRSRIFRIANIAWTTLGTGI
ncbi:hypothetical protein FRX31_017451 [Thalictrum thalictroides]|uniref:UBA domain-containing protein n=1 Tax=Thalictrum thalictroides TaxID=46969 RepID=A0A7J6W9R4_THATH|nr:hypothetical protein FRX31_017451 [Thalictrum thalictroides]